MPAEIRYALRALRRSPLFAVSVAATIGLGLGVVCSAFTLLNAYVFRPIDLPDPYALFALSWDTAEVRTHRFTRADYEALRDTAPHFSSLAAAEETTVMQNDTATAGLLVSGNYFQLLGGTPALGRLLTPADAAAPGDRPVVVLSDYVWRTRYGSDANIVGTQISLGRQRFEVVGVTAPRFGLTGEALVGFWAPLTMARAFETVDPWSQASTPTLSVIGRLRTDATATQARAWFDVWLRQRFSSDRNTIPTAVRLESRATPLPLTGPTWALFVLLMSAFGLVLLVACANVTNLLLARGLSRQREIAVRLSLGSSRWRVVRQLAIESLVLSVPASLVGLAITMVSARAFPAFVLATFPAGVAPVELLVMPIDPDLRVLTFLSTAAVLSALLVTLAPALRATRGSLVHGVKGDAASGPRRSRLRATLVALQIGACALFLVCATGLIDESQNVANPDTRLSYEKVAGVRVSPSLRVALADRLAADPAVERVAAAQRPPLIGGPLWSAGMVASMTNIERSALFTVVSPEYFPMFDIRVMRGRAFTADEADQNAPVVLVSEATARRFWPGLDPIGQTLETTPASGDSARRPPHTSVRVIGVTEDVVNGILIDGIDESCIYFATSLRSPVAQQSLLVRGRTSAESLQAAVTAAVKAIEPNATYQFYTLRSLMGTLAWMFQLFSIGASLLGVIGLLLAFSGTYAVVAFLMTQRTREFGIRMALGATVNGIVSSMIGETLRIALAGLAVGLGLAGLVARYVSGPIPFIPVFAPDAYIVGAIIVVTATAMAALLPSLRAARIDPSKALRVE